MLSLFMKPPQGLPQNLRPEVWRSRGLVYSVHPRMPHHAVTHKIHWAVSKLLSMLVDTIGPFSDDPTTVTDQNTELRTSCCTLMASVPPRGLPTGWTTPAWGPTSPHSWWTSITLWGRTRWMTSWSSFLPKNAQLHPGCGQPAWLQDPSRPHAHSAVPKSGKVQPGRGCTPLPTVTAAALHPSAGSSPPVLSLLTAYPHQAQPGVTGTALAGVCTTPTSAQLPGSATLATHIRKTSKPVVASRTAAVGPTQPCWPPRHCTSISHSYVFPTSRKSIFFFMIYRTIPVSW